LLRCLAAAREKDDQYVASLGEVHAVASTCINLQLGYAAGEISGVAGVAVCQPGDTRLNLGAGVQILQAVQPLRELEGTLDFHSNSVALWLHAVNVWDQGRSCGQHVGTP
jgi:hypothetical protein